MEKTGQTFHRTDKDQFFDMLIEQLNKLRTDEQISHVFLVGVLGAGKEEGETAGVFFLHNLPDNLPAAQVLNHVSANIFLSEMSNAEQATKN